MSKIFIGGKVVDTVDLLRTRRWSWRLDVWPFAVLYSIWLAVLLPQMYFADALILLFGIVGLHALVLLFTAWSVDFKCTVQHQKVTDIHYADACKITPAKFSGNKEVVALHFRKEGDRTTDSGSIYFDFRKQRFIYSEKTFNRVLYPTKEPISYYQRSTGYGSDSKVAAAYEKWGYNVFEYPRPTFQMLMREQLMEPFFVFQVFCVGLWCLDEYWYYSLFTLLMLVMFEATMAKSRLKTLKELRRVKVDTQTLMVHRLGKWLKLPATDLLPGDVLSVGRSSSSSSFPNEDKCIPADLLLLSGTAIVNEAILTGESTPQWKVSIGGRRCDEKFSIKRDKSNVLFGGTKILQHTPDKVSNPKAPDGGCLAVVLRTGFETSQGKLMRTILFSTERVTANNWESGLFILFLVVFAVIAAGYVLKKGLEDPTRSKYKLLLSCSLIVTSVIPPELPMELSIAVNTSLIALARRGIFCTEPFRIPFAGKVDLCCFDKTGTLTSDDMEFSGLAGLDGSLDLELDMSKAPVRSVEILATCHALVFVDNKLVGDPLEKAALRGVDWTYRADEKAIPKKPPGNGRSVKIVQRHHFASHLKRMSVVVQTGGDDSFFAYVKGAPEVLRERLAAVPPGYVDGYKKFTRQGSRVLALGFKPLPDMTVTEARSLSRDDIDCHLAFAGFAVFNCPIRSDSASVMSELTLSSHDLVMITGDQALTACHVAAQVGIVTRPALVMTPSADGHVWVSPDETDTVPFADDAVADLSGTHDLCVTGDCLEAIHDSFQRVVPHVRVFARVSPDQKELVMTTFRTAGRVTMMCGDGTNDVGALKQAHVGVALLNAIPAAAATKDLSPKQQLPAKKRGRREAHSSLDAAQQKLKRMIKEAQEEGDGQAAVVKLGDASMASPFTAKHASVSPTADVIRQGRSALVTTMQMFKILGLNCLATAYVLSVMYLDGVKLGDVQATINGVFTAAFFLFISHARPLPTLSAARPHPNVFCAYVFVSLLGQFAMHIVFLMSTVNAAGTYMPDECIDPDSDFHPNLVNTVSFVAGFVLQLATFTVNYIGHPFNQSIPENRPFLYALLAAAAFTAAVASDLFRDLNDWLKLVPMPKPLRNRMMLHASIMLLACFLWERLLRLAFPGKKRSRPMRPVSSVDAAKKHC